LSKANIPVPFNMPPEIALTTLAPMGEGKQQHGMFQGCTGLTGLSFLPEFQRTRNLLARFTFSR
jgi:predicted ABC-class ATPase